MSILINHIQRNIKENRVRSILIVFSIMLCTSVLYVSLNMNDDILKTTDKILQEPTKDYDICVFDAKDSSTLPAYKKSLNYNIEAGMLNNSYSTKFTSDISQLMNENMIKFSDKIDGFDPKNPEHAIMSRETAIFLNLKLGDTFTYNDGENIHKYTLAAISVSFPLLQEIAGNETVFVAPLGSNKATNGTVLALENDKDLQKLVDDWEADGRSGEVKLIRDLENPANDSLERVQNSLIVIVIIVILTSFFVVWTSISLVTYYRIPVLGAFRSIGATRKQIISVLLLESAFYGILAILPSFVLGEIIRYILRANVLKLGYESPNLLYIVTIPIFAIIISILQTLIPIVTVSRIPIRDMLFKKQSKKEYFNYKKLILGILLFAISCTTYLINDDFNLILLTISLLTGLFCICLLAESICYIFSFLFCKITKGSAWLGSKNLADSKINRFSVVLLITSLCIITLVYTVSSSVAGYYDGLYDKYPYDIMIKNSKLEEKEFDYIKKMDFVDNVNFDYWTEEKTKIQGDEAKTVYVAKDHFSGGIDISNDLLNNLQNGQCVLDEFYAAKNHIKQNDTITFELENLGKNISLEVVGFCNSSSFTSSRCAVIMTYDDYTNKIKSFPKIVGINVNKDVYSAAEDIRIENTNRFGNAQDVLVVRDYISSQSEDTMNVVNFVSIIPILVGVLALFGLVNFQLIAFNQKKHQYAVLHSNGMSKIQLRIMIFTEIVAIFIASIFSSFLLGIWSLNIIIQIMFVIAGASPLFMGSAQITGIIFITLGMLAITSIFPIYKINRLDTIKEIKYE